MTVIVKPGLGWINGYFLYSDSDYILELDIADGVLKRIDRVVMRLNHLTREIEIAVKKGAFASTPVAPSLQRDANAYELALADVLINNGAINITQANITDLRLNTQLCGIVHGTVNQVDTTTIFNQYQAWFNQVTSNVEGEIREWQAASEQQFMDWFNSLQVILDGDVAANLANKILLLEQEFNAHKATDAINAHRAENISFSDPNMTATDVKEAIKEVFTSGNNVKIAMVDALLQVDPSLPISYDSTWEEIEDATGQISTGKKQNSGITSSNINGIIEITGLDFTPRTIVAGKITNGVLSTIYNADVSTTRYLSTGASRNLSDFACYVQFGAFKLIANNTSATDIYWEAIE
ncbi:hypothetical protein NST02_23305 [Robertmurraya sp. FSL W8-0741]|uniref:hypothetical protein n=1 Tax=Robertmurraya sp. FSL W8-0741 TaxID=2954629 RepID=UPI0030FBDEC3